MTRRNRISAGVAAATGPRRKWQVAGRQYVQRAVDRLFEPGEEVDYIELAPVGGDPSTVADLAARVNWFLSRSSVPVYLRPRSRAEFAPEHAPHMDASLVADPGWLRDRPPGRAHVVVHDLRPTAVVTASRAAGGATLASPWFNWRTDQRWFELQRRFEPDLSNRAQANNERLLALGGSGASAFVLGTGPSAALVDPLQVTADVRIACNSIVRNNQVMRDLRPDVVAFTDPVFHCGPSRYAAAFRRDVEQAIAGSDVLLASGQHWIGPVLSHHPKIAERLAVVEFVEGVAWRWPTYAEFSVRTTANVLTLLMLPLAFSVADRVEIAGCDGRRPGENYFWKHNATTQYSDELMQTVFAAHPGFFRDRDYVDYYEEHCRQLEELIGTGERAGKSVDSVTPSFIPALSSRSAVVA